MYPCVVSLISLPFYRYEDEDNYTKYIDDILDFLEKGIFIKHIGFFSKSNNDLYNKLLDKQDFFVNNR